MGVTESAWEREQRREVEASLAHLHRAPALGECAWTGRTDNTDLGTRDLSPVEVVDPGDDWPDWAA